MTTRLIGGTDVPRILGIAPFGGPIDAYRRIVEGYSPPMNPAMKRGLRLEPVVRAIYVDETEATLEPHPGYLRSKRHEFMGASVDDLARRDGEKLVAEYKTAGLRQMRHWGESGTDQVPDHYRVQVAWYLAATGLPAGDLAVLIAGDDFRCYRIERDLELESMLLEACERFWVDHVKAQKPPPPDASEGYSSYLAARYPNSNGAMLTATPELERLARSFQTVRGARELAEDAEREARNKLVAAIGEADGIQGDGWRVTYRPTKGRAVTDWKAVVHEACVADELVAKHTTRNPNRTFRAQFQDEESTND